MAAQARDFSITLAMSYMGDNIFFFKFKLFALF
jgi:hypothetical protein